MLARAFPFYLLMAIVCASSIWLPVVAQAQASKDNQEKNTPLTDQEKMLLDRMEKLEQRLAAMEAMPKPVTPPAQAASVISAGAAQPAAPAATPQEQRGATRDSLSLPGFVSGTTLNFLLDGYYEYNFNRPVGRVNLLRPYDPSSNSFTLNQGAVVIERTPDPSQGRRFGLRLDLMFGQTTESLAGNPANDPRTAPYRNIFQAYGTYVFPLGKGLNVDFGRFASSLGFEGSFAKDQINYTRSLLFASLPFYHMGFRSSYKLGNSTTATWVLVNGINQTEDFNGFKSNHLMLSTSLSKSVSWTGSYYVGQENRDLRPMPPSNVPPVFPTQPGLSTDRLNLLSNGRTHIADTYLTWNVTPKLTLAGEGDYIVSRLYSNSFPSHLAGGAGYVKYQFAPVFSLAGRFEYVSDRGGFLSGTTQALKEGTLTATYQPVDGFQVRWEFRHDYSNQPFFLTRTPGFEKKEQNTALLGLLWWFGGKQASW
jgi:hypothetical protein